MQSKINVSLSKYEGWGIVAMLLAFIAKLSFVLWSRDKGFDLMDEGSHILMYKYPEKYILNIHNFHYLLSWLPSECIAVKSIRNLWIISQLIALLVLLGGIINFYWQRLNIKANNILMLILFCCNGLFISVHDRFLAYNDWLNFFIYPATGFFLLTFRQSTNTGKNLFYFITGAFFSIPLLIKPSTSLIMLSMIGLLLLLTERKIFLKSCLFILSGMIVACTIFINVFLPPIEVWLPNYLEGVRLAKLSGYMSKAMIIMYALNFIYYSVPILISTVPVFLVLKWYINKSNSPDRVNTLLIIGGHLISTSLLMFILFKVLGREEYNFDILRIASTAYYDPVMIVVCTSFYIWIVSRLKGFRKDVEYAKTTKLVTAFIYLTPFAIFFGALSTYQTNLYGHLAPVLAVTFVLISLFKREIEETLTYYFSLIIALLCSFFFVNYIVLNPPHLLSAVTEQKFNVGSNETLLVDSATAVFIGELRDKVSKCPDTESIIHVGNHPGIVYLLNKYQPGVSIYNSFPHYPPIDKMIADHNNYYYLLFKNEIEQSILLLNAGVNPEFFFNDTLKAIDLNKFELVDSVFSPYLDREKVSNKQISNPFTYIFVPLALLK